MVMLYGKVSPADPWRAKGLEWRTSSPPPKRNFLHTPIVTDEPYDYHDPETGPEPQARPVDTARAPLRFAAGGEGRRPWLTAAGAVRIAPDPLREPWSELARQREAATFGMWLFLMSEMLFFGALFMAFSFSRAFSPAAFMEGARHTEIAYGAANTVVLVTSSLTVTLAVRAADIGRAKLAASLSRRERRRSGFFFLSSRASNIATTFDIISSRARASRSARTPRKSSGPSTGR